MKNYKAVIIDGRKVIKRGLAIITVIVLVVVSTALNETKNKVEHIKNTHMESIISESIPVFSVAEKTNDVEMQEPGRVLRKILTGFFTFDPYDCTTLLSEEIPLIGVVGNGYLARKSRGDAIEVYNPQNADMGEGNAEPDMPDGEKYPIKSVDSSQGKALGKDNAKILIRNETAYSIDIDKMLTDGLSFDMKGSGPKILILHTHATECYSEEGAVSYSPDKSDRTLDAEKNVIKVGERMKQVFEANGIETLHDTTLHDHPNFNGSYANSLKTAQMYKAKYPSIRIILDIHRDAYVYDDGSKAKFVTKLDGKDAAQLMMVVGTDAGGLEHPNWRENMKLALKLQKHITDSYPSLMRGVNLRKERFNGHTTAGSLIIEVGSSGNTMKEALHGAECVAAEIADFLNKL